MKKYLLLFLFLNPVITMAECNPDSDCYNTMLGVLEQKIRHDSGDGYSHLLLNGNEVYKTKTSYMVLEDNSDGVFKGKKYFITKAIISFSSGIPCVQFEPAFFCDVSVVLDLTSGKPVISNSFTSDSGDSHIDWVSWGKANSIIVFQDNSKFKYSNGHVEKVVSN